MKIIILTQYFPPEVGAPQSRLSELASHLVKRGHSVTVLTAMPNYPTGKIHPNYKGFLKREVRDNVNIIRTFIIPTQSIAYFRRLTSYISFVLSSSILGSIMLGRADFLFVESPPLFLGLAGIWLSWWTRARMIFNVSDLWPETAVRIGILRRKSLAFHLSDRIEALCYGRSWLVSGQSKSILADISERFPGIPTFHLSNGVNVNSFSPSLSSATARATLSRDDKCVVLYAGLHGIAQGLDQVLSAVEILHPDDQFWFTFIGDGPEKKMLQLKASKQGLTNVSFLDARPAHEMPELIAAADIILVTLKTFIPGAVPSKLYEAMSCGKPVVLVAAGEAEEIVREHGVGITVEPGDVKGLAQALKKLQADPQLRKAMGGRGRHAAEGYYNWENIALPFIDHLEANINNPSGYARRVTKSDGELPYVTVILPVRNEIDFIRRSLGAVLTQDYPAHLMEVIVADGMSTDGTREVIRSFQPQHPNLRWIDNPGRIVPTALNAGIAQARGQFIVRVDGHCEIAPDYVRRCIDHLLHDGIDGVGGPLDTVGQTPIAKVIAVATSSSFGVGNSAFRTVDNKTMLTDTVAFPAYTREIIARAGPFDEELVRNQDDEYNYRLRKLGAKILLAADVRARYYSRSSLRALWRQFFQYGYWKVRVMQKHPRQMRLRHFAPPLFVTALLTSLLLMPLHVLGVWKFGLVISSYIFINLVVSLSAARKAGKGGWRLLILLPVTLAILHLSYGFGFLIGLAKFWRRWGDSEIQSSYKGEPAQDAERS